ncbi:MAG TPA: hypothetical protein VEJ86_12125, partial [Candidatus Binataceae bacterium]|nr:hypothetical protein [Candidatus Binataceae bacterium]
MSEIEQNGRSAEVGQSRAIEIYNAMLERIHRNTDHMFAGLMIFQWFAGIVAALVISPRTWEGPYSQ